MTEYYKKSATEWCLECKHETKPNATCRDCMNMSVIETKNGVEIGMPSNFERSEE